MSILTPHTPRIAFGKPARYLFQCSTLTTWRPVRTLQESTVQTFRRSAFIPSLPAKLPKTTSATIPASVKWFQEPWPTFNSSYLGQFGSQMIQLELTGAELAPGAASVFHRTEAPFGIFLRWAAQADIKTLQRLYVAQAPLNRLPKPLQDDIPTPEIVLKAGRGDIYDASIWLGIAPTYTPLHSDPNPNLYLQFAGRKVIRMLQPDAGQSVFAAVQSALGKQTSSRFRGDEMMEGREKDLLEAEVWHNKTAAHVGFEANLEAGESIFIPQALRQSAAPPAQEDTKFGTSTRKRKDGSEVPSRAKRSRYISIACLTEAEGHDYDGLAPFSPNQQQVSNPSMSSQYAKDPLWTIGKDEAMRLCRVYDEEIGMMYPMLDIEQIIEKADKTFTRAEAAAKTGLVDRAKSFVDSQDVNILKMILATVLILEGGGQSELGSALFETVRGACESKLGEPPDIGGLRLLVIMAQFRFQQGAEIQAYRIIGLAARLSFEMGLHRNNALHRDFANHEERSWALKLFWSIFVLDRRWSFGAGLPFAIQDGDIDPSLPELDGSTPYLTAMIAYGRIASKVWRSITAPGGVGAEIQENTMSYLDYQVLQWQNTIPDSLRFYPTVDIPDTGPPSRAQRRLQVLLYLRMNQMRILIYRPVLHSATSIMENRRHARMVVEVAKDTIRVLSRLNQATDIYRAQQVCFNHFLVSALAALFLAVSHAPVEFNQTVRDEFYMAIDLVSGFSAQSHVSMRLWQTIKGLKEIGPRLGLVSRQALSDDIDPHSSAAVAMAGLAGHRVNDMTAFPVTQGPAAVAQSPVTGPQMSYELTNLFEAAGGHGHAIMSASTQSIDYGNGYVASQGEANGNVTEEGARVAPTSEREFSKIMQALF
ncbi:MAG: hypothetical protein Q9216_000678 [Gyalolechia sp. 2 TL-2023]